MAATASSRLATLKHMAVAIVVPTVPVMAWWKWASDDRHQRLESVRTKVRVPNVQTVDDLLIETCKAGDVILFDRRPHKCATGPGAALACILSKLILCPDDPNRVVEIGTFDHVGLIVPGFVKNASDALDPGNLLILEATPGEGIVARPLLTRLEMTASRTVILLPLHVPGDHRNDQDYEPSVNTRRMKAYLDNQLATYRDNWLEISDAQNYRRSHSIISIFGALGFMLGLHKTSKLPVSPAAWIVLQGLQAGGAAEHHSERTAMETKPEDFLRDHRFRDDDCVRLRPGWKFLPPVTMRSN